MRILLTLGILLFVFLIPAQADSFPTYSETGWFTITGNNSCGGPCVETVNLSFEVTFATPPSGFPYSGVNVAQLLPGSAFTSSGPLNFGSGEVVLILDLAEQGAPFFLFANPTGTEFDMYPNGVFPPVGEIPGPLTFGGGRFFLCDLACSSEYLNTNDFGIVDGHFISTLVTPAPEPGAATLIGIGLGIGLLGCFVKRERS